MILEIKHLFKSFQQPGTHTLAVLKDIAFGLEAGQTCAVNGQSGSGKTTLLSLIAGLDTPDSGQVLLDGKDLCAMTEKTLSLYRASKIGIVFQQFHLMPHLTAKENISLPLEILKMDRIKQQTDAMLEEVGLQDRRNHLPGELSGGECQRVAIARALVIKPALLLADEPFGNLDTKTGDKVAGLLFGLVEKENKTMILVTHNTGLAGQCKKIMYLENGQLT
jgi:putative ABC transport system ATP-binding protein